MITVKCQISSYQRPEFTKKVSLLHMKESIYLYNGNLTVDVGGCLDFLEMFDRIVMK